MFLLVLKYLILAGLFAVVLIIFLFLFSIEKLKRKDAPLIIGLSLVWPVTTASMIVNLLKVTYKLLKTYQRFNAIRHALYYGLVPWQLYEQVKHYKGSYIIHALSNIGYALKWLFFLESDADREFEKTVNHNF